MLVFDVFSCLQYYYILLALLVQFNKSNKLYTDFYLYNDLVGNIDSRH